MKDKTFLSFKGISEFYVTLWVDKTRQEAGSWALNPAQVTSDLFW